MIIPCALGFEIRVTPIALTGTPVPGTPWTFRDFGVTGGPAEDGDVVVFYGGYGQDQDGFSYSGIFTSEGGTINKVVDTFTPIPGTNANFFSFSSDICVSGPRIYFGGGTLNTYGGIFKAENGVVTRIFDNTMTLPGTTNPAVATHEWAADGDVVVFGTDYGIYAVISNVIVEVATTNTPIPGGGGTFTYFGTASIDGDKIAFSAGGANNVGGIYLSQTGQLSILVNNSTPIPGSPGILFQNERDLILRNNGLAFNGNEGATFSYEGIYRLYDGVLSAVANSTTPMPDQAGNFVNATSPAFDGGNVAFLATRPDFTQGLYTFVGDQMVLVADHHSSLSGIAPISFWLNPRALSGNSIAFGAVMNSPSGAVHGVFRADIVPGDAIPVSADYSGDGSSDQAYYDPDTATWFIRSKDNKEFKTHRFGYQTALPAPGDYDADGVADLAVYDPYYGNWFVLASHDGFSSSQFGYYGAVPVPADYDGDGRTDQAVFDPGSGWWFILGSTDGFRTEQFGYYGVRAVPADFDNDGKTDIAVYEDLHGLWYIHRSGANDLLIQQFGYYGVTPVTSDFDGQGADFGVFDSGNGNWYTFGQVDGFALRQFGYRGVRPVSSDYDGDAKSDLGVYDRNSAIWYLLRTSAGFHVGGL